MKHDALYHQFGRFVRAHRLAKGLSQEKLASRLKLSRTSITNIERGKQRVLLHQVFEIAAALDISPEALVPTMAQIQTSEELERTLADLSEALPEMLDLPELKEWVARVVSSPSKAPMPETPPKTDKAK